MAFRSLKSLLAIEERKKGEKREGEKEKKRKDGADNAAYCKGS
jgi:hypothetical protein